LVVVMVVYGRSRGRSRSRSLSSNKSTQTAQTPPKQKKSDPGFKSDFRINADPDLDFRRFALKMY